MTNWYTYLNSYLGSNYLPFSNKILFLSDMLKERWLKPFYSTSIELKLYIIYWFLCSLTFKQYGEFLFSGRSISIFLSVSIDHLFESLFEWKLWLISKWLAVFYPSTSTMENIWLFSSNFSIENQSITVNPTFFIEKWDSIGMKCLGFA